MERVYCLSALFPAFRHVIDCCSLAEACFSVTYVPVTFDVTHVIIRAVSSDSHHGFTPVQVEVHLARVLNSEAFRASQRCQDFLRHVVSHVLSGNGNSLKERNIATDVFGRGPNYNSAEDSFVRVKASEVRRRLATYYASSNPEDVLRIELPLGTYVPQFFPIEAHPVEIVLHAPEVMSELRAVPVAYRRPRWFLGIAAVLSLGAIGVLWQWFRPQSALDEFWSPILKTANPLLIFLPIPTSYGELNAEESGRFPDRPWAAKDGQDKQRYIVNTPHNFLGYFLCVHQLVG